MKLTLPAFFAATLLITLTSSAQVSVTPLATWSPNGDGWLAPGEGGYTFLGTANNERGMGYGNGHVYVVSRNGGNNIRILNAATGADLGALNVTGISGGTFAVNNMGVGSDGAIYVANLTTASTATGAGAFKIYRWATEASVPTVAYSGTAGITGVRAGDDLAVFGSGSSTLIAAGYNSTPSVAGNNGYAIIDPTLGTATAVGFVGTPPNAGDLRLGITFVDSSHVLGTAGSSLYRNTSFSGATGTLINSPAIPDPAGATADRLLATTVLNGMSLLAVQSIGDSHVSIYDISNPSAPIYLASGNATSGSLTVNGNATGEMAWGAITDNGNGTSSQTLYGMSSNQGIQAFVVTVPEPGTFSLVLLGAAGLALHRRIRG